MKRHYRPMLAQSADAAFDSKDWIFEIKWDGIRAISYVNEDLHIESRNGKELIHNFPELEELKKLAKNTVVDGEIVVMKDGKADFQMLLERSNAADPLDIKRMAVENPATYIVFDILEKDGKPVTSLPLTERKNLLRQSLKEGKNVLLSMFVEQKGTAYYEAATEKGVEGIIAKKKDSPYRAGLRSDDWLKIKKLSSCDCVIFGYTSGQGSRKNVFGALILGLYERGKPVFVGKVGTGFSEKVMEDLKAKFGPLETEEKTLVVADSSEKITWLRPELVCEVVYQSVTKDGKLRMARFRGLRPDKMAQECTLDQIVRDRLGEYASKRDFTATLEPKPKDQTIRTSQENVFVVQEHHARTLHFDLRLERKGFLKSWAVPKGVPQKSGEKRLAVETEDHPLEYANFEGTIPEGQYGAGIVKIWDKGIYKLITWEDAKIEFTLDGEKLRGKYVLAKFKKAGEKNWLLLKGKD